MMEDDAQVQEARSPYKKHESRGVPEGSDKQQEYSS